MNIKGIRLIFLLSAILIISICTNYNFSNSFGVESNEVNFKIYPSDSKPYGISYGDWTGKWSQWINSIPVNENPLRDTSGVNCAQKQSGPVWFLVGTDGGEATRKCTIPYGKSILFPVINAFIGSVNNPELQSETDFRTAASKLIDSVTHIRVTIDGKEIPDADIHRISSPLFNLTYPENNLFNVIANTTDKGVSDGYWIFLEPLSKGEHKIHFGGSIVDITPTGNVNFVTDTNYESTIN